MTEFGACRLFPCVRREMQVDEETVLRIADELDRLADDPTHGVDTFETVTNKLRKLGMFTGFGTLLGCGAEFSA
jgi:hypothetical protein